MSLVVEAAPVAIPVFMLITLFFGWIYASMDFFSPGCGLCGVAFIINHCWPQRDGHTFKEPGESLSCPPFYNIRAFLAYTVSDSSYMGSFDVPVRIIRTAVGGILNWFSLFNPSAQQPVPMRPKMPLIPQTVTHSRFSENDERHRSRSPSVDEHYPGSPSVDIS